MFSDQEVACSRAGDEFHAGKPTSRNAQCQVQMYKCGPGGREGKGEEECNE